MKGSPDVSVLQGTEKVCYLTGRMDRLEQHHIYYGSNRQVSDDNGLFVYITHELHRGTYGVHGKYGHDLNIKLKQECQRAFEEENSHEEFMRIIGRNYL